MHFLFIKNPLGDSEQVLSPAPRMMLHVNQGDIGVLELVLEGVEFLNQDRLWINVQLLAKTFPHLS